MKLKTNKSQEQLYNRILINFGIATLAYLLLYLLYNKVYLSNLVTFPIIGIFVLAAVFCYIYKKKSLKNYGHMFVGFAIALLFTKLSVIFVWIFGFDAFEKLHNIYFFKKLLQSRTDVIIVCILGVVYLIGMFIYNCLLMRVAAKNYRVSKKKKK